MRWKASNVRKRMFAGCDRIESAVAVMRLAYDEITEAIWRSPEAIGYEIADVVARDIFFALRDGKTIEVGRVLGGEKSLATACLSVLGANDKRWRLATGGRFVSSTSSSSPRQETRARRKTRTGRRQPVASMDRVLRPARSSVAGSFSVEDRVEVSRWYGEYHDTESNSHKFYAVAVADNYVVRVYGRCPNYGKVSRPTTTTDVHSNHRKAYVSFEELRNSKEGKGYEGKAMPSRILEEVDREIVSRLRTSPTGPVAERPDASAASARSERPARVASATATAKGDSKPTDVIKAAKRHMEV